MRILNWTATLFSLKMTAIQYFHTLKRMTLYYNIYIHVYTLRLMLRLSMSKKKKKTRWSFSKWNLIIAEDLFVTNQRLLVTRHAHSSTQGMTPHPEGYSSFAECIKCKYITKRHVICALHLEGKNHPVAYQLLVNNWTFTID